MSFIVYSSSSWFQCNKQKTIW